MKMEEMKDKPKCVVVKVDMVNAPNEVSKAAMIEALENLLSDIWLSVLLFVWLLTMDWSLVVRYG